MFNKGFTLIEAIVAIFILTTGTMGAFSVIQRTVTFISVSSSRLTASYLAQEGLEIVRNFRDSNYLQGLVWDNGLVGCATGCEVDYNDPALLPWTDPGRFLKTGSGSPYNYSIGDDALYKRKIIITPGVNVLTILVEVSWQERGGSHQVVAETRLHNWR